MERSAALHLAAIVSDTHPPNGQVEHPLTFFLVMVRT